ncbi:EF-hand domain-containing protein [Haloferula sargassicola]|uniref:EF-hand domain-containing protein n=1 Tax=Haloferula sargassicola TaxID=490096 RepID=A0ABP9UPF1_9BACT
MKTQRILGLTLLAAAPLLAQENDGPPGPPRGEPGPGRRPPIGAFISKADTDGDGKVSKAEFDALERISNLPEEKRSKLFSRLDRNGNGVIEGDELKPPRGRGPRPMPDLRELDLDKDGTISFEEFEKGRFVSQLPEEKRKRFFEHLDRDGDGRLTPKDHRPGEGFHRMFGRLDEDHDGLLSFEEFRKAPWIARQGEDAQEDQFEELDKNGDQKLDPEEMRRGADAHRSGPPAPSSAEGDGKEPPPPSMDGDGMME